MRAASRGTVDKADPKWQMTGGGTLGGVAALGGGLGLQALESILWRAGLQPAVAKRIPGQPPALTG